MCAPAFVTEEAAPESQLTGVLGKASDSQGPAVACRSMRKHRSLGGTSNDVLDDGFRPSFWAQAPDVAVKCLDARSSPDLDSAKDFVLVRVIGGHASPSPPCKD